MDPFQSSLGIEIKEDALILVELRSGLKEIRLQNSTVLPFSFPLSPEAEIELVDALKRFLRHSRVRSERIVVGVPRRSVVLKTIDLPSLKKENIPQLVEYEIEKHLPFRTEDVYYDFELIEKIGENLYRVLLAAVKKDFIDPLRDLFERVPLRPKVFDISSLGIFNAFSFRDGFSGNICALIFLDHKEAELEVVRKGHLVSSRSLTLKDGDAFVEGLQLELGRSLYGINGKGEEKVSRVILSGPGSLRAGLAEAIKERLSTETKIEDPSTKVTMRPMGPEDRHSLIPAIGLALRGLGEAVLKINFLPHELEIGIKKKGLFFAISLIGIITLLGMTNFLSDTIKDSRAISELEERIKSLRPEASRIEKIQAEIKVLEDQKRFLDRIKGDDVSKLDLLSGLAKTVPPDAWIISLDHTETSEQKAERGDGKGLKGELIISGFATSASKLIPLLEDSPLLDNVEFAGPITTGVEDKERFRIKARTTPR